MNYLDYIILVPTCWGLIRGFRNGLILELASLVSLLIGLWIAFSFSWFIEDMLREWKPGSEFLHVIAFLATFILAAAAVNLTAQGVHRLVKAMALGMVNRLLGALFGGIKWCFFICSLFYIVSVVDSKMGVLPLKDKKESLFYEWTMELPSFLLHEGKKYNVSVQQWMEVNLN